MRNLRTLSRVNWGRLALSALILLVILGFVVHFRSDSIEKEKLRHRTVRLEQRIEDLSEYYNAHTNMRNSQKFPPLSKNYIPILMYVYSRPDLLRETLAVLRNASGIEETVLIISHDGFVPEVGEVVDSIDFVRVKQIIHPVAPRDRGSIFTLKDHWW